MIMEGMQPLAQELLTYTSPGGSVRVPVTVSVDTRGSYEEEEVGRELKALTWERVSYAKISNKATLALANRKDVPVDVEIRLRFGGHDRTRQAVRPHGQLPLLRVPLMRGLASMASGNARKEIVNRYRRRHRQPERATGLLCPPVCVHQINSSGKAGPRFAGTKPIT